MQYFDEDILYGYQSIAVYSDEALTQLVDITSVMDSSISHYYVVVQDNRTINVTIHVLTPSDQTEFDVIYTLVESGELCYQLFDYLNLEVYGMYSDSELLHWISTSSVIEEDCEFYIIGVENKEITITVVSDLDYFEPFTIDGFASIINPYWDIYYYFEEHSKYPIIEIVMYSDEEMTQIVQFPIYIDTTIYCHVEYESPTLITIVSIDDLFGDFTIESPFGADIYYEDLYYDYLCVILMLADINDVSLFFDENMTNPLVNFELTEATTIYVKLNRTDYYSVDIHFVGEVSGSQTFTISNNTSLYEFQIDVYLQQIYQLPPFGMNIYTDAALQTPYNESVLEDGDSLYVEIVLYVAYHLNYIFDQPNIPDYNVQHLYPQGMDGYDIGYYLSEYGYQTPYYSYKYYTDA